MHRIPALFDEIVSLANLWRAFVEFRRGKRRRDTVLRFERRVGRELPKLARELASGKYEPDGYRLLAIREPKRRLIAAAPVRDRIVHHAIHRVIAPQLDRRLIDTTFACLEGRGSHRALLAFVRGMRRYRHVLLLDVRHYFPSIDREILLDLLVRNIKGRRTHELLRAVLDSGAGLYARDDVRKFVGLDEDYPPPNAGLPIGNLTSQWWGNHYLSGLDHFVKRELRIPHYQRYMDDFSLFADDRDQLEDARAAVTEWLREHRRLRLKHPNAAVRGTRERIRYLGHVVTRTGFVPRAETVQRMRRRVRHLVLHGDAGQIERSVASYLGVLGLSGVNTVDAGDRFGHRE